MRPGHRTLRPTRPRGRGGAPAELGWPLDVARANRAAPHQRERCSPRKNACSPGRWTPRPPTRRRRRPSTSATSTCSRPTPPPRSPDTTGSCSIVGPAGAGKTSALRSAVADLAAQRRPVFGVAPSAKAARVLQRDAGLRADTVAKLLHEWERGDRPPLRDYLLPAGTTVIVDEAGMIGTSALARLVALAEQRHWRLALVGDHRQLQAVGRGGLFHELCATGRSHELQRIHRFDQKWEAAASLQLRNGDPRALNAYEAHDRIVPDTFERHLERIADIWLDTTARGDSVAITTSTNDHVDAINAAVQAARIRAGQLDPVDQRQHRRRRTRPRRRHHRHPPQRPTAHHRRRRTRTQPRTLDRHRKCTPTARSPSAATPDTAPSRSQPSTSPNTSASATPPPNTATNPTPSPSASNSSPPRRHAAASTSAPPAAAPRT